MQNYRKALKNAVKAKLEDSFDGLDNDAKHQSCLDISIHGMESGIIGGMIYNNDVIQFFNENSEAIYDVVVNYADASDQSIGEFLAQDYFVNKVESFDNFRYWMSFCAFEIVVRELLDEGLYSDDYDEDLAFYIADR